MTSIGPRGQARPADSVHARAFDEELVILDLQGGEYYALDPIGTMLWQGLASGQTIEEIAADVVREFDVTRERAIADLVALADDLLTRGLLVRQ